MPKQETFFQKWRTLIILFVVILIVYALAWLGMVSYFENKDGGIQAGTFGDQFGAINALFSGLALAGVIYTLIQQQKEMQAQRREFMTTRAMNSLYKQVEIINNAIDNIRMEFLYINSGLPNTGYKIESHYKGHESLKLITDFLLNAGGKITLLDVVKHDEIWPNVNLVLRTLANGCQVLQRIREIEDMEVADSLLMIDTFKYNVDSKLWYISKLITDQTSETTDAMAQQLHDNFIKRINSFLDLQIELDNRKDKK